MHDCLHFPRIKTEGTWVFNFLAQFALPFLYCDGGGWRFGFLVEQLFLTESGVGLGFWAFSGEHFEFSPWFLDVLGELRLTGLPDDTAMKDGLCVLTE